MLHEFLHRHPELEKYLPDIATGSTAWHVVVDGPDWEKAKEQNIENIENITEEDFKKRVHSLLPENIIIEEIRYQLQAYKIVGGTYRISYCEFNGEGFIYDNKYSTLIDVMDKSFQRCLKTVLKGLKICTEYSSKAWIYNQAVDKLNDEEYNLLKDTFSGSVSNKSCIENLISKIRQTNK
jgi:hypothetical protein